MNQTLKNAIREVEALPEAEQEELGRTLLDMALRKKIDARLEAGRKRGAARCPRMKFMAELRAKLWRLRSAGSSEAKDDHSVRFSTYISVRESTRCRTPTSMRSLQAACERLYAISAESGRVLQ